eukprot:3839487-Amphidinium_carterae.1
MTVTRAFGIRLMQVVAQSQGITPEANPDLSWRRLFGWFSEIQRSNSLNGLQVFTLRSVSPWVPVLHAWRLKANRQKVQALVPEFVALIAVLRELFETRLDFSGLLHALSELKGQLTFKRARYG